MATAFLSIGANLGDRVATCLRALEALAAHPNVELVQRSSLYETEPVGGVEQPPFVNLAAELTTRLEPEALLRLLKATEVELGREPGIRWGPRIIDLDLLVYDDRVIESDALSLPHPRMHERRFVLEPLAEIAPGLRDPRSGRTALEMLTDLGNLGAWVRRFDVDVSSA
jgi:2-amino-4-hydroxy-6-hydroxymethyldihydropteridine diphosphokinase